MLNISKDEKERARLTSEYKFAVDLQSKMVDAKRDGRHEQAMETAQNMIADGEPVDKITKYTGLTREEVEKLSSE